MTLVKQKILFTEIIRLLIIKLSSLIAISFHFSAQAQQTVYTGEDDMKDIFAAGGYGALFGATMGTAILPFLSDSPLNNLRVVAGGLLLAL